MKADEAALKEVGSGHAAPTVVVGIADYKTRKCEKAVNGKMAMVDGKLQGKPEMRFAKVVSHHDESRNATQSVKDLITWLRCKVNVFCAIMLIVYPK